MFEYLQIYDPRERRLVGIADLALGCIAAIGRLVPNGRRSPSGPRRVLLLRLERIGDLLMTAEAIANVRQRLPEAEIHLAVGSWNAEIASLFPGMDRIETLDLPWLARNDAGASTQQLIQRAREWRRR